MGSKFRLIYKQNAASGLLYRSEAPQRLAQKACRATALACASKALRSLLYHSEAPQRLAKKACRATALACASKALRGLLYRSEAPQRLAQKACRATALACASKALRGLLYRSEAPQRLAQKACRAQWRARELGSLLSKRLGSSDHEVAYERVIASGPKESMELVFGLRGDA